MKEPEDQLARWLGRLGEYDFEMIYRLVLPVQAPKSTHLFREHWPTAYAVSAGLVVGQVMQRAVGVVEKHADSLKIPEKIYLTKVGEATLLSGWSLDKLRRA